MKTKYLFCPILENNHFYAILLDMQTRILYCLDSGRGEDRAEMQVIDGKLCTGLRMKWNRYSNRFMQPWLDPRNFKYGTMDCCKQSDNNNCGVFCGKQLAENKISFLQHVDTAP